MDTDDRYNVANYEMGQSFTWEFYPPTPEEEAAERRRWNHPWRRLKRRWSWLRYRLGSWIAGVDL